MNAREHVVIILDDDLDLGEMLAETLHLLGHPVIALAAPLDAERIVLRGCPSVMVLDMKLDGRYTGIEMAQRIREGRGIRCPLIGITASLQMAGLARESGLFCTVLEKPFELTALIAAVTEAIGHDDA
jgi:DNA-binding NtrC family response regulator